MSIFRDMMSRIFRGSTLGAQAAEPNRGQAGGPASDAHPGPDAAVPATEAGRAGGAAAAPAGAGPAMPPAQPSPAPVDVEAVLSGLAARNPQRLDWRHSIVDLMKLLELDSSLATRKELARELGYGGAANGSAEMNLWLHRAVMRRLAENGGRVPDELRG